MGKIVEKKKKKKGRPSLLDLQKRNLRLQKHQPEEQKPNPNPNPYSNPNFRNPIVPNPNPNPNRRFTRRNRNPDGITEANERIDAGEDDDDDDDDDDDSNGKRREKKLKLVLRLPSQQQNQRSSLNSSYLNSGSYVSDSNAEDENGETPLKKRKINAVGEGSGHGDGEKGEKSISASKATETHLGKSLESGPTTPLPDKKLLVFILDRLQKKDSYGVFSEPVDPKELPDYHEIVEHPMDFGTVRKKLSGGAYASLEQFEKDVFLICSNAMQYNASDTIYFRQARSIQELAKKNFENLRQDSDDNEPEPKIVRRGRPPTKNLKKPMGKDSAGSEFSTDAMLATRGDNAMWSNSYDLRKGPLSDKYGSAGVLGRTSYGSRNSESYTGWSAEHKSERNGEFSGSTLRGLSTKYGKKQFVLDENRRDTYKHYHPSVGGREPSVLTTFDGEKKQLMAVGLHTEHGYARSLARFAANLGPVAWKMASKKIERVLPAGVNFGPGWVGENEAPPPQPLLMSSPPRPLPPQQPCTSSRILPSATTPIMVESKGERLSNKQELLNNLASDGLPIRSLPSTTIVSSSVVANTVPEPTTECVGTARGLSNESGFGLVNSSSGIRPPFQIHQNPALHPSMNGFNSGFGFNLASQMGKLVRPVWPAGSTEASMHSQMLNMVSRSNNFVHLMPTNRLESENPKVSVCSGKINSENSLQNSSHEAQPRTKMGLRPQPSWHGLSMQQKQDSGPPDLNVRFQSPGSPSSSTRVDSTQPDLALQL